MCVKEITKFEIWYGELNNAEGGGTGRAAFGMEERQGHCGANKKFYG
jgi:hypothetical protein